MSSRRADAGTPGRYEPRLEPAGSAVPVSGRRRLVSILAVLALLSAGVFAAAWLASWSLAAQAQTVQRLEPHDPVTAELLGERGTLVGSPQRIVVRDRKALLPGTGPNGERYLNERYLRDNGVYPLQLKTVHFVRNLVAWASGLAALALAAAWWTLDRRERNTRRARQERPAAARPARWSADEQRHGG